MSAEGGVNLPDDYMMPELRTILGLYAKEIKQTKNRLSHLRKSYKRLIKSVDKWELESPNITQSGSDDE